MSSSPWECELDPVFLVFYCKRVLALLDLSRVVLLFPELTESRV